MINMYIDCIVWRTTSGVRPRAVSPLDYVQNLPWIVATRAVLGP